MHIGVRPNLQVLNICALLEAKKKFERKNNLSYKIHQLFSVSFFEILLLLY